MIVKNGYSIVNCSNLIHIGEGVVFVGQAKLTNTGKKMKIPMVRILRSQGPFLCCFGLQKTSTDQSKDEFSHFQLRRLRFQVTASSKLRSPIFEKCVQFCGPLFPPELCLLILVIFRRFALSRRRHCVCLPGTGSSRTILTSESSFQQSALRLRWLMIIWKNLAAIFRVHRSGAARAKCWRHKRRHRNKPLCQQWRWWHQRRWWWNSGTRVA